MERLPEGSIVHVPAKKVGLGIDYPSAMVECRLARTEGRLGIVDKIPFIDGEKQLDLRLISEKLGFLIVQLGDFQTEEQLLEPLYNTICTATELVLMPEYIWKVRLRSIVELSKFWSLKKSLVSHLVLIGHGSTHGITAGENELNASTFLSGLDIKKPSLGQGVIMISLCCKSGNGFFGKNVSGSPLCKCFIGPSGSVHAANASSFYSLFLSHSLIEGLTIQRAYQISRVFTPGVTDFNMWQKKNLVNKPNRKKILDH